MKNLKAFFVIIFMAIAATASAQWIHIKDHNNIMYHFNSKTIKSMEIDTTDPYDNRLEGTYGITNGHSWIQLWAGGPKWAEFNVGSTISSYSNLKSGKDITGYSIEGYNTDNIGGLYASGNSTRNGRKDNSRTSPSIDYEADIAKALWGAKWKTPEGSDFENLINNCVWTWCDGTIVQYSTGCMLQGWKVAGKGSYANNSIFLPVTGNCIFAAGYLQDTNSGFYWGVYGGAGTRHILQISSSEKTKTYRSLSGTVIGFAVRAICNE